MQSLVSGVDKIYVIAFFWYFKNGPFWQRLNQISPDLAISGLKHGRSKTFLRTGLFFWQNKNKIFFIYLFLKCQFCSLRIKITKPNSMISKFIWLFTWTFSEFYCTFCRIGISVANWNERWLRLGYRALCCRTLIIDRCSFTLVEILPVPRREVNHQWYY